MSTALEKFLRKLNRKDHEKIMEVINKIKRGEKENLDIKILKGHPDTARVRVGRYRIVFRGMTSGNIRIAKATKRDERTYDF